VGRPRPRAAGFGFAGLASLNQRNDEAQAL
jgi:hypothetical protein